MVFIVMLSASDFSQGGHENSPPFAVSWSVTVCVANNLARVPCWWLLKAPPPRESGVSADHKTHVHVAFAGVVLLPVLS